MPILNSLPQQAYDYLKEAIVTQKLDNRVHSETQIARRLAMSRTPVREALQRLSHEGFIDILPSRGFIIHSLTEQDILSIYQMRSAIETYCLVTYAESPNSEMTQTTLAALEENLAAQERYLESPTDAAAYAKLDCGFHDCVITSLHNPLFQDAYAKFSNQLRIMIIRTMHDLQRVRCSVAEHHEICDILRRGNSREAARWMHRHIDRPTEVILASVREDAARYTGVLTPAE